MHARVILTLAAYYAVACALGFGAASLLVSRLSRAWRAAGAAHWTERARLAYGPGYAVLLLAALLPVPVALVGGAGVEMFEPRLHAYSLHFWPAALLVLAGVMTVRYRWLRELWGPRVTLKSWLAGCLVVLVALVPHLLVWGVLLFLMPDTAGLQAVLIMAAGVLAVLFFAAGGGILLLRMLTIVKASPPELTQMVNELAREMKVPGRVRVFEIQWAQVNAVASLRYRAVGFSRPLLEALSPQEVRAVAAHELGHLLEPEWVRAIRLLHMLAYLATLPIMKFGGPAGPLAGWTMVLALLFGYQRFSHRMEARADRLENKAIAHHETYMRSMVKLHEANLTPAVMPGTQTHPNLYDRLLAEGIQPEFPRPLAPSREKPIFAMVATVVLSVVLMFLIAIAAGCAARFGL